MSGASRGPSLLGCLCAVAVLEISRATRARVRITAG